MHIFCTAAKTKLGGKYERRRFETFECDLSKCKNGS